MQRTEIGNQDTRMLLIMGEFMPQQYPGLGYATGIDVERDRVIVKVGETVVAELAPQDWAMTDQQVRDVLRVATMKKCGPGYPPPIQPPIVKLPDPRK